MVGQRVVYYVFTERPAAVPRVPLGPGRRLRVERVARERRWQDLSMARMRAASGAGRPSGPRGALRALHRRGPALQRRLRARGAGRVGGAAARLALPLAPAAAALRARRALGRRAGPRGGRLLLPRGRVRGQRGGPAAADGALRAGPAAGPRARPGGPLARREPPQQVLLAAQARQAAVARVLLEPRDRPPGRDPPPAPAPGAQGVCFAA